MYLHARNDFQSFAFCEPAGARRVWIVADSCIIIMSRSYRYFSAREVNPMRATDWTQPGENKYLGRDQSPLSGVTLN